jgi:outer membrane protein OmpA-like peptidoglycan-associated protein
MVASNQTPAGRIENRRVEIEFRRAARPLAGL